jgi:hypothetical protein
VQHCRCQAVREKNRISKVEHPVRPRFADRIMRTVEQFMRKARHPDAEHQRTPLKNKLSCRKEASGRGPSRELFGTRHPAALGRRSGLAAGLVPVGAPGRQHGAQPHSPPPQRPHILPNGQLLAAASLVKWPGRGAVLVRRCRRRVNQVKIRFSELSRASRHRFAGLIRRRSAGFSGKS